ncbi:hypothetical protein HIM_04781 [Hirsutella minnesotensis 3608]|uniref:Uncharacterized protein n=1 Tax=Hirsutella minnesotensis 3608 TaxID=1043627 RepID=A0A0F8A174_9HYPO|nr:hypothetical protein HIM_04781 [Hirsutella minnesotensis 3608]
MSPDTVSSLFPDRPIRPLPKRRLRERLSPEVAQSIKYPPSTHDTVPLFYYPPYTVKEEVAGSASIESTSPIEQGRRLDLNITQFRNGVGPRATLNDDANVRSTLVSRSPPEIFSRAARNPSRPDQPRPADPQPPPSAASSVDGYDSFENTNNKKKRKIPSASDSAINPAHSLNSEISSLAISTTAHSAINESHADRAHHGSSGYAGPYVSNNQGFSGPGRGRLGRSRNGRSPLRSLPDGNNAWPARSAKAGASPWTPVHEGSGIISSAIANAGKLPSQGQENVSLLHQHSTAGKTAPASTQFTFTCDSQVPGTVQWPGQTNKYAMSSRAAASGSNAGNGEGSSKMAGSKGTQSRRKSRRRLEQDLNLAARHRRQVAAENYYNHPPKPEDVWICEFCEYEQIFGEPPRALIREYEIKDRRQRQEESDRKRLLEKAKAKSRKGKKSGKSTGKNQGAQNSSDPGPADVAGDQEAPSMHGQSTQSEGDGMEENSQNSQSLQIDDHPLFTADVGGTTIPMTVHT